MRKHKKQHSFLGVNLIKILKKIAIFFISFLLYHIIFSRFFPTDENNVLQAPDWYVYVGIALSIGMTILCGKIKEIKAKLKPQKTPTIGVLVTDGHHDSSVVPAPLDPSLSSFAKDEGSLLFDAVRIIYSHNQSSVSMIQRYLKTSYIEAAQAMAQLERLGIVSEADGVVPRSFQVSEEQALRLLCARSAAPAQPVSRVEADSLTDVDVMDGHDFEYWCAGLLRKNGFSKVEVTAGSGDHGVDIFAEKGGVTYAIQCKRYAANVDNSAVQQAYTAKGIFRRHVAVVMTNQYFTRGAKEDASEAGVLLWDRDKLQELFQATGRPD